LGIEAVGRAVACPLKYLECYRTGSNTCSWLDQSSCEFYFIEVGKGRPNEVIMEGGTARASADKRDYFGKKIQV
jgi:hypothetical protein